MLRLRLYCPIVFPNSLSTQRLRFSDTMRRTSWQSSNGADLIPRPTKPTHSRFLTLWFHKRRIGKGRDEAIECGVVFVDVFLGYYFPGPSAAKYSDVELQRRCTSDCRSAKGACWAAIEVRSAASSAPGA